ncbi:MAG: bifunctional serine/threonine-protein kinase/formylglycine-generating enzyme family protein [Planctomycetota bacterium]
MTADPEPGDRLERALELFLARTPTTAADAERLLAEHDDLRELLEPMLAGPAATKLAADGDRPAERTGRDALAAEVDDGTVVLGDYRLVRELGRGGMGIVYEAWQRSLDRRVAVTVLAPALGASPSAGARVRREAAAAGRLRHPHIVEVLGFGSDQGQHFFAMQFVDGAPLHDRMAEFREPARAVALTAQLADALAHAHAHGLVHRDVKPGNVLLRKDGHALLTDFGVARDEALPSLTQEGGFLGTVDYASPEQLRGEVVDARTDVFALGVVLCELLTGAHPFRGPTPEATMQRVLGSEPPPLQKLPGVGDDLAAVVGKALAKSRLRRYGSMQALLADLQALADGRAVSVRLPTTSERLVRWIASEPWQAAALAVFAVGAVVAGSGFLLASRRADDNLRLAGDEAKARTALADKVRDYDLLAGVVLDERALQRIDTLVPAWPERAGDLRRWLTDDCGRLAAMQPAIATGITALRARELPRSAEERAAERRAHPQHAEWSLVTRQLAWLRTCVSIARGERRVPAAELPATTTALPAAELNQRAWDRTAPQVSERKHDDEPELGLQLAELAVAKARGTPLEHQLLDTLAWARLANGRFDDAKAASAEAAAKAPADERARYEKQTRDLAATIADRDAAIERLGARAARLDAAITAAASHTFAAEADQFLHDTLVSLQGRIDALQTVQRPRIEKRLRWAEAVAAATFAHPHAQATWAQARAAIAAADGVTASTQYRGRTIPLADTDVHGLVPIGCNPVTKLWEFYDLASAWNGTDDPATLPIPTHRADGSIEIGDATGVVFVLLPGGPFWMGAQAKDPQGVNHDPEAPAFVGPAQQVELEPFLLARHELTQGQWARLCSEPGWQRPSGHPTGSDDHLGGTIDDRHPVERVTWTLAQRVLAEHGMVLPTEAQWEYGCRAGASTPWWTGADSSSLHGAANVYDQSATRHALKPEVHERFDDGHVLHAPVGSFRANAFGLFDTHGNVGEWCLDAPAPNGVGFRAGDGARLRSSMPNDRSQRGGSFQQQGRPARSSMWVIGPQETRVIDCGVRAVRRLGQR